MENFKSHSRFPDFEHGLSQRNVSVEMAAVVMIKLKKRAVWTVCLIKVLDSVSLQCSVKSGET